jgi:iron complex outermembrane receptor protein
VTAALSGFESEVVSDVVATDGGVKVVDFVLNVALTLNEVVTVIGKVPADSLEAEAIRESPARDIGEALADTAGVWKVRKGGIANDVVLRGLARGDLNVLIDGQRLYGACPNRMDPASFHVDFSEVDRVDVGKGPFDMKNQGSLGGTVNIVTQKPEEGWHAKANLAAGSFSYINPSATVSYGNPSFSVLGGYSYRTSKAYRDGEGRRFTEITNYKESAVDEKAFEIGTAWARLGWAPRQGHKLQLSYTRQDVDTTYYPYLRMDAVYDDTDRLNGRYDGADLSRSVARLTAQGYYSRVKHWMTDEIRTSAKGSRGYSMGTLAETETFGGKLETEVRKVTLGLEVFNRFWGAATEMAGMQYMPQYSIPDVDIRNVGVFAEFTSALSRRFTLSAGGRIDYAKSRADESKANTNLYYAYQGTRSTSATDTFPSGKVRLTYAMDNGIELGAGLGHAARIPEHSERYFGLKRMGADWVGNPNLSPARNTGLDGALSLERTGFFMGANVYVNWVGDYIAVHDQFRINSVPGVKNTQARSYTNLDATYRGGEVDVVWSLADQLFLSGDISYVRATKDISPEENVFSDNVAEIPPLRSRLKFRYDQGKWFGSVEGVFSARQENVDTDLGEEPTAGYGIANLKVGMRHDRLLITGGVDNLFNKFYIEYLSYQRDPFRLGVRLPEPGRNIFFNVSYRF